MTEMPEQFKLKKMLIVRLEICTVEAAVEEVAAEIDVDILSAI